ncbi:G1 family glutamic endopeptidase [Nocardia sp. NPDC004860]|uniref:G1 family glutamic endopeptidase n=1 Tax=Nocardia sp. NPDC004860 TaxID=3154557 RepID=UPI0033BC42FF
MGWIMPEPMSWESLGLQPASVDGYFFDPNLPAQIDTATASDDVLKQLGIPSRPDAAADADAYTAWKASFEKTLTYIPPKLTTFQRATRKGPMQSMGLTSSSWAGGVIPSPAGQTFKYITGRWKVPAANTPTAGPFANVPSTLASVWVGLDGGYATGANASGDVFQAGTDSMNSAFPLPGPNGAVVWTEWFPAPGVNYDGFPCNFGDDISVAMQFLGPVLWPLPGLGSVPLGRATITNHTTKNFTGIYGMVGPQPSGPNPFVGNTAEWIVETPQLGSCTNVFAALPALRDVTFDNAATVDSAGSESGPKSKSLQLFQMDNSGVGIGRNNGQPGTGTVVAIGGKDAAGRIQVAPQFN